MKMLSRYYAPILISMLVGFSSLSIEVLWVRIISFSLKTIPQAFAYVLIIFLFGIAVGAFIGKRVCASNKYDLYAVSSQVLMIASVIDITSLHFLNLQGHYHNILMSSLLIFLTASLKSIVFPIAHHLGSNDRQQVAKSVSYVYFGNIIGSTLGPLIAGFFLLAYMTTAQAFYVIGAVTMLSALLSMMYAERREIIVKYILILFVIGSTIVTLMPNEDIWYRLFENSGKYAKNPDGSFKNTIESHYGVINVVGSETGDIVYGFGIYDGRINTKLSNNSNIIDRAYRIAGFHNKPNNVLIIGLSTGSWANVVSWIPDVQKIDVVEIDPGYLELIRGYPEVSGVLDDSRFSFFIDDGRRWLNRHPDVKYDLILMNTTYHFRNNITNLLSLEFFKLIKSKLNEDGVFYYNTTGSPEAFHTATLVFKNSFKYRSFVVASDSKIPLDDNITISRLAAMQDNQGHIFDMKSKDKVDIEAMLNVPMVSYAEYKEKINRKIDTITDNNPVTEYKHGYLMNKLNK